jgi:cyclohexadieny/prephenate dehydrogenase
MLSNKTITIIGCGLIGSSLARSIKKSGLVKRVNICDSDSATVRTCTELQLADFASTSYSETIIDADIIIIATPVASYAHIAENIAPHLKAGAIISDVGSVKVATIEQITRYIPPTSHPYVPAHPIAGTENSGINAGFAELFEDKWCIITTQQQQATTTAQQNAVTIIKQLWQKICKSRVTIMDAEHHDMVLAITSHLPHMCAYTAIKTAADIGNELEREVIQYSASGFRDFTRVAASDPTMWRDIMLENKQAIIAISNQFIADFKALQTMIIDDDHQGIEAMLSQSRSIRRALKDS